MTLRRVVSFTIPGDVLSLSPNRRLHPMARVRLVREWREKAWLAWRIAGHPRFQTKVKISFHVRRRRLVDECNLVGSGCLKAICDGLKDSPGRFAMIPDDSPKWLKRGEVTQEVWRDQPSVQVIVEEMD